MNTRKDFAEMLHEKFEDKHLNTDTLRPHLTNDKVEVEGFKFNWNGKNYDLQLRYLQEIGAEVPENWRFYIVNGDRTPVYQSDLPENAKSYLAEKISYNRGELKRFEPGKS